MLGDIIRNIETVRGELTEIAIDAILLEDKTIIALNRKQLQQGRRADDELISPNYSNQYAKKKGRKVPNLKVSGEFYDNIYVYKDNNFVSVSSQRTENGFDVADRLEEMYTSEIYGINSNNKKYVVPKIWGNIFKTILKRVQNG
jgi:hypothetical protein